MPLNHLVRGDSTYRRSGEMDLAQRGVAAAILSLLELPSLLPTEKRGLLTIALWKWTEAAGIPPNQKYNVRYASEGALDQSGPAESVNHEHVFTRKSMIDHLLAVEHWTRETLWTYLQEKGVACVVTVAEHARLGGVPGQGWSRYRNAGVRVRDLETGCWLDLDPSGNDAQASATSDATLEDEEPVDGFDDPQDEQDQVFAAEQDRKATSHQDVDNTSSVSNALANYAPARAGLLRRLVRTLGFADTVAIVGVPKAAGAKPRYIRIHDTRIDEPTRTVAWLHWGGRVSLGLQPNDVPGRLHGYVTPQNHPVFGLACRVDDEASLEAAEDLVLLALHKLRREYDAD